MIVFFRIRSIYCCNANAHFNNRCANEEPIKLHLPYTGPADWLITGLLVAPGFGLQRIQPIRIQTETEAHLTLKAPPSDLIEGEQFQIKFSVRSSSSSPIKVPVRKFW